MRSRIIFAVALLAAIFTINLAGTASAAPVNPSGSGAVRQAIAGPDTVNSAAIINGSVGQSDLYGPVVDYLRAVPTNGVFWANLNNGIVSKEKLAPTVQAELDSTVGEGFAVQIPAKAIEKIGGPFATNATVLGTFVLPAGGLYNVNTAAKFDRVNADHADYLTPATETMPTLALRFTTDDGGVGDAGTVMGAQISKAGFVELTGSSVASVRSSTSDMTVTVYGFGYSEDRSGFGGVDYTPGAKAQFTAAAKIVVDQIG